MTAPTLAIEQLLLHPQFADIAAYLQAQVPLSDLDQTSAANRDATDILRHLSDATGGVRGALNPDQVAGWLRVSIIEAWVAWISGSATTCTHSPHPSRPQPVLTVAWKPGLIVCFACIRLTHQKAGSVADRTCDACGHVCAGVAADDPIFPCTLQLGALLYQYGVCTTCKVDVDIPVDQLLSN